MSMMQTKSFKNNLIFYEKLMFPVLISVVCLLAILVNEYSGFSSNTIVESKSIDNANAGLLAVIATFLLLVGTLQLCVITCAVSFTLLNKYGFKIYLVAKTFLRGVYLTPKYYSALFSDQEINEKSNSDAEQENVSKKDYINDNLNRHNDEIMEIKKQVAELEEDKQRKDRHIARQNQEIFRLKWEKEQDKELIKKLETRLDKLEKEKKEKLKKIGDKAQAKNDTENTKFKKFKEDL